MFFTILFACIIMIFTYEFMPYILDKINLELELSNYPKENKLIQIFVIVNGAHIFWFSKLYSKGLLIKMATPYIISLLTAVIIATYGVQKNQHL